MDLERDPVDDLVHRDRQAVEIRSHEEGLAGALAEQTIMGVDQRVHGVGA